MPDAYRIELVTLDPRRLVPSFAPAVALVVAVALLVAACQSLTERRIDLVAPARGFDDPLPITITDRTGTLVAAGITAGVLQAGPENAPGRPDVVRVSWLGGMCDERIEVEIARIDSLVQVAAAVTASDGPCLLAGIERGLELTFAVPVPVESLRFSVNGREQRR